MQFKGCAHIVFKISILNIIRKPIMSLILLFIFILFSFIEFIALTLNYSAQSTKQQTMKAIGSYVILSSDDSKNSINKETIAEIEEIDHVVGTNYYYTNPVMPINFEPVFDHTGVDPIDQEIEVDTENYWENGAVNFEGNSRNDLFSDFTRGLSTIVKGDFPSEFNQGVIIEERLAKKNNFSIGDYIYVKNLKSRFYNSEKEMKIEIVGIYKTKANFEILETNILGELVYTSSPYNHIFSDIYTAKKLFEINSEPTTIYIYLDSTSNIDYVVKELEKIVPKENFSLTNMTNLQYEIIGKQLESVSYMSESTMIFTLLITISILLLFVSLYSKSLLKESSILLMLGLGKVTTSILIFIKNLILGLLGTIISHPFAYFFLNLLINKISTTTIENVGITETKSFITNSDIVLQPTITLEYSIIILLYLFAILIAAILIISIYSSFYIIFCKPKELLFEE